MIFIFSNFSHFAAIFADIDEICSLFLRCSTKCPQTQNPFHGQASPVGVWSFLSLSSTRRAVKRKKRKRKTYFFKLSKILAQLSFVNFVLREEFALLFQTFSRNDLPGEAPLSRGRSVFNYVNASIPREKTGYYLFLKVTF